MTFSFLAGGAYFSLVVVPTNERAIVESRELRQAISERRESETKNWDAIQDLQRQNLVQAASIHAQQMDLERRVTLLAKKLKEQEERAP